MGSNSNKSLEMKICIPLFRVPSSLVISFLKYDINLLFIVLQETYLLNRFGLLEISSKRFEISWVSFEARAVLNPFPSKFVCLSKKQFYIVIYYTSWVTTSWTYSRQHTFNILRIMIIVPVSLHRIAPELKLTKFARHYQRECAQNNFPLRLKYGFEVILFLCVPSSM